VYLVSEGDALLSVLKKAKAKSVLQQMWDFLVRRSGIGNAVAHRDSIDDRIGIQTFLSLWRV
jgi:hypothetical protein